MTLFSYKTTLGKESIGSESYNRSVVEINENTSIKEIAPLHEGSESVSIMFATYARPTNKGNIFVKVTGEKTKEVYVNQTVNVKDVLAPVSSFESSIEEPVVKTILFKFN